MLFLFILSATLLLLIIGVYTLDDWSHEGLHMFCSIGSFIVGVVLFIALIGIPITRYHVKVDIKRLEAFRHTIEASRAKNMNDYERFALLKDVAEWNQKLEACKYDNSTYFDLWIPDEINDVKTID